MVMQTPPVLVGFDSIAAMDVEGCTPVGDNRIRFILPASFIVRGGATVRLEQLRFICRSFVSK